MRQATFLLVLAAVASPPAWAADPEILPPKEAFRYESTAVTGELRLDWTAEPGYYLYKKRFAFESLTDGVDLGEPALPRGKLKVDEFFGEMETYRDRFSVRIPYTHSGGTEVVTLQLKSQGCADIGICFPPQTWTTDIVLPASTGASPAGGAGLLQLLADQPGFGTSGQEFLPPEEAFLLSADMADPYTLRVRWNVADGYYLYREKFGYDTDGTRAQLGAASLPAGVPKHDEFFGAVEVYYGEVEALIPISRVSPDAGEFELRTSFQGCAEDGICYPPMTRATPVLLPAASAGDGPSMLTVGLTPGNAAAPAVSEQDRLALLIRDGTLPLVLVSFFGFGLLLAFTPCVLPMVPILSGIIVGQGPGLSTRRAFALSLVYVLAMAVTYTVAGVIAARLGQNLQAAFQHPLIITLFSALFVAFALAMFGMYELQIPGAIQARLAELSNRQQSGKMLGVATMGVLSALIVGPCVAAPLAAALIYIGQSGDPVRGGLALFFLSLGMGAPLLAFGTSAGRLLPKAGRWMEKVKDLFGLLMLGIAIWMLSRILPGSVTMLLWAALAVFAGLKLGALRALPGDATVWQQGVRAAAFVALGYGALLVVGTALGARDPLAPLAGTRLSGSHAAQHLAFQRIKSVEDLQREVAAAAAAGRPALLDFYADWCVSCKEMEKYTFTDERVQAALGNTLLLQADVTANDEIDQALLKHFGIFGPPTIAFFGADGREQRAYRVVGFVPADKFHPHVLQALAQ